VVSPGVRREEAPRSLLADVKWKKLGVGQIIHHLDFSGKFSHIMIFARSGLFFFKSL